MWGSGNLAIFDRAIGDRQWMWATREIGNGQSAISGPLHDLEITQSDMARLPDSQIANKRDRLTLFFEIGVNVRKRSRGGPQPIPEVVHRRSGHVHGDLARRGFFRDDDHDGMPVAEAERAAAREPRFRDNCALANRTSRRHDPMIA